LTMAASSRDTSEHPVDFVGCISADEYRTGGTIDTLSLSELPDDCKSAFIHDAVIHRHPIDTVLIMYNPISGGGVGKTLLREYIIPKLESCKIETHVLMSEGPKFLTNYLLENKQKVLNLNINAFIVVGGDGTYHEFINGYIGGDWKQYNIPVLFLSGGTGNSLCLDVGRNDEKSVRSMLDTLCKHIQTKDPITIQWMDCIELTSIEESESKQMEHGDDISESNIPDDVDLDSNTMESKEDTIDQSKGSHLTFACSQTYWGVPAACGKTAESLRFFGGFRYDIAALYQIMRGDARNVKLTMYWSETDSDPYELMIDVSVLAVMKNKYFGKGLMITPLAKLDNGLLDVILLPNVGRRHTLGLFGLVPKGTHILKTDQEKGPFYFRCQRLTIEPEEGCNDLIGLDGEEGPHTPLTITTLPKAIPMIYF